MVRSKRNILTSIITVVVAIIIALIIFFVKRNNDNKGTKIYLDTVMHTEKYTLSFARNYDTIEGKAYCSIHVNIVNELDEDQTFTFKNAFFKKASGTKVTFGKLNDNGFTIKPHENDYYWFACPINSNSDATGLKLHFSLNGDYYNLYITNSTTTA